MSNFSIS